MVNQPRGNIYESPIWKHLLYDIAYKIKKYIKIKEVGKWNDYIC